MAFANFHCERHVKLLERIAASAALPAAGVAEERLKKRLAQLQAGEEAFETCSQNLRGDADVGDRLLQKQRVVLTDGKGGGCQ